VRLGLLRSPAERNCGFQIRFHECPRILELVSNYHSYSMLERSRGSHLINRLFISLRLT
jgi:hypothetical protein